jgi:hypothetical protein
MDTCGEVDDGIAAPQSSPPINGSTDRSYRDTLDARIQRCCAVVATDRAANRVAMSQEFGTKRTPDKAVGTSDQYLHYSCLTCGRRPICFAKYRAMLARCVAM